MSAQIVHKENYQNLVSVIKVINQAIRELRAIARQQGLHGYDKVKTTELIALISGQLIIEMPLPPPKKLANIKETCTSDKDNSTSTGYGQI